MTLIILRMAKLGMARKVDTVRHTCACSEQHIYRHWWQVEAVDRTALRTEWRAERERERAKTEKRSRRRKQARRRRMLSY